MLICIYLIINIFRIKKFFSQNFSKTDYLKNLKKKLKLIHKFTEIKKKKKTSSFTPFVILFFSFFIKKKVLVN